VIESEARKLGAVGVLASSRSTRSRLIDMG
jgi:hypothetical protein